MRKLVALAALSTSLIGLAACSGGSSIPSTSALDTQGGARKSFSTAVSTNTQAVYTQGGARKSF